MKKFYITTPIYYPNAKPHIGSAYTTIIADFLKRFYYSLGYDVYFLTGTDEHGMKISETAKKHGMTEQEWVDQKAEEFKQAWEKLDIKYDRFIRTTDKDHEEVVKEMLQKAYDNDDIYLGKYEGWYCVDCERYYTEKELVDGLCPIHKKPVKLLTMDSYFFRLSKYQNKLLDFYNNSDFLPKKYAQEVINRVKEGLKDVSISRPKSYLSWGIELPFDKNHVTYVWFDALLNYVSGIGYERDKEQFKKFWPADVHLIGKDILWFHAVYWPAFLMSLGLELPKHLGVHGFLTVNGQKISKSLGNVIDPVKLSEVFGIDAIRFYLLKHITFGDDGDFDIQKLKEYYNNELVNGLGNLMHRTLTLVKKLGFNEILQVESDKNLLNRTRKALEKAIDEVKKYRFHLALDIVWNIIGEINRVIDQEKPWKLIKEDKDYAKKLLRELYDSLINVVAFLKPFLPEFSAKCNKIFEGELSIKAMLDNKLNADTVKLTGENTIIYQKLT